MNGPLKQNMAFKKTVLVVTVFILFAGIAANLTGIRFFAVNRVSAEGINITSRGGDRIIFFEDAVFNEPVKGDAVVFWGDAEVNAPVEGDLVVVLGDIILNSKVSGNVASIFGYVKLDSGAEVDGDVISTGNYIRDANSKVLGEEINLYVPELSFDRNFIFAAGVAIILSGSILLLLAGFMIIFILREKIEMLLHFMGENPLRNTIYGFLLFIASTILTIILFITLAIPLVYLALAACAGTVSAVYFGRLILGVFKTGRRIYAEFMTGLIFISLINVLLLFIILYGNTLAGITLYLLFSIFVYSFGSGMLTGLRHNQTAQ